MRYPQTFFKAHEADPKASSIHKFVKESSCIHCGKDFQLHKTLVYTQLDNEKVIW